MAKTLTITINDDAKAVEIIDALIYNIAQPPYQDEVEDPNWEYDPQNPTLPDMVPNPVTKEAFFKQWVIDYLKSQYLRAKKAIVIKTPLEAIENEDLTMS
jgi:hypothetical protein